MVLKIEFDLEYLMDEEMAMNLDLHLEHYLDSLIGRMMDMSLEKHLVQRLAIEMVLLMALK